MDKKVVEFPGPPPVSTKGSDKSKKLSMNLSKNGNGENSPHFGKLDIF